jgi:outer membrane protein insertion porin family/translocation and assembly module TamA
MHRPRSIAARMRAARAVIAASLAVGALGCGARPPCNPVDARGCIIEKVRILQHREAGGGRVSTDDVADRLATAESSLLVTKTTVDIFREKGPLFFRYERFDRLVLERDLERVERVYRARGFYEAKVRAARVIRSGESTVTVEIEVDEGPPTRLAKVALEPADATKPLPSEPADLDNAILEAKADLAIGAPLDEDTLETAKRKIARAMTDRGYAYAEVAARAIVDLATHSATVTLSVSPGPICTFGAVTIEGLGDLPEAPVRAALGVVRGRRFSTERLDAGQTALAELGVLSSIQVEVMRAPPSVAPDPVVPVRYVVQPGSLRSVQVGGGAELGGRVQAHLVTSWEHKNFLGGLRRFATAARTGVVLYPLQLTNWNGTVRPLPDIRTQAELAQPGFLEARTRGSARVEVSFYRPETADANADASTQKLYENLEVRGILGIDRPFWRSRIRLGLAWSSQYLAPFGVWGTPPPTGFGPLFLTYGEARAALDLRYDKNGKRTSVEPNKGLYVGASVQVAGIYPDSASDVRIQPEVRAYAPISKEVTLGLRVAGGFLFPFGYGGRFLDPTKACAPGDGACELSRARDVQLLQLRGFYSGGMSSNRGYGYNGVNPQETIASLFVSSASSVPVPIGGRWMWNASLELRFPIWGSFGGTVFVDSSDVWNGDELYADGTIGPHVFSPHLSPGIGLRYATPIGPARLDLGVRVPCAQHLGRCREYSTLLGGQPKPFGLPVYLAIAIGEAF